jgi:ribosomal protein S28E/S33
MQTYKPPIIPVVTHGSETWILTKSEENLLRNFGRKILWRIYGPVQEGDIWRIINNEELNRSINGEDIVCGIRKSSKDKMAGICKENGSGSDAEEDDGRKTVYRTKERKTSFEMDR